MKTLYALFSFEHDSHGVPISKLIITSSEKSSLVDFHTEKLGPWPLIKGQPKEVAVFRSSEIYKGYFIGRIPFIASKTTPKRVEKKSTYKKLKNK